MSGRGEGLASAVARLIAKLDATELARHPAIAEEVESVRDAQTRHRERIAAGVRRHRAGNGS